MTHKFSLNLLSFRSYRSIETVVVSLISYDISVNNRAPSVCKHCRSCDLWFNHLNQLQCCQELVYSIYSLEIWSAGISVSQRTWTQSVYVCLQGCCWAICTPKKYEWWETWSCETNTQTTEEIPEIHICTHFFMLYKLLIFKFFL